MSLYKKNSIFGNNRDPCIVIDLFLSPNLAIDFFSSPNVVLLMVSQTQLLQENIIAVAATNNLFLFQVLIELSIIKDENSGSICYFPIFRRIISVCDDVSPP